MVRGLDLFRRHFAGDTEGYVLIGGVAASLLMEEAGLTFRATKDLDIVLVVEVLDAGFGARLWEFIKAGAYEIRQSSSDRPRLYRFAKPGNPGYPYMLELFCRQPDGIELGEDATLTPIPIDEAVASLSAILMDDEAYAFLMAGRTELDGLRLAQADRLIPLKASAWLDLSKRVADGEKIDSKDVRLFPLLGGQARVPLPPGMAARFGEFLTRARGEVVDLKAMGVQGGTQQGTLDQLALIYGN
jgi:hypothetical protein